MTAPLFSFDHVTVRGQVRDRIHDVSVDIHAGRITALVGPSGAGKSTLLRCCNRLEVPDVGVVRFNGDDLRDLDPRTLRCRVGMVFQRPVLFPGTIRDNLLAASPGGSDDRLTDVLGDAGLDAAYLDRGVDELSGGEGQRACIARALMLEPEVLLADEATSSLDGQTARDLEATARSLVGHGRTLLWVTHDLAQARRLADDVIILDEGHVVETGPVSSVLPDDAEARP